MKKLPTATRPAATPNLTGGAPQNQLGGLAPTTDSGSKTASQSGLKAKGDIDAPAVARPDPKIIQGPGAINKANHSGVTAAAQVASNLPSKADADYDYVVVGAGAAGCVTAARLAEQGHSVLVLEGGKDVEVLKSAIPAAHGASSEDPNLSMDGTGYFVDHFGDAAKNEADPNHTTGKGIFYPRGTGVGGSTRMNAMIFVRPDDVDWDKIAEATGDPSWKSENMQQYMNVLEKNRYRPLLRLLHRVGKGIGSETLQNIGGHGFDGWLETTRADPKLLLRDKQLLRMVWETTKFSFKELGGIKDKLKRLVTLFDPNDNLTQGTEGLTLTPTSITQMGRRNGPRDRLFDVAEKFPDRVTIQSGAKVDKVLLDDNNEAVGVSFRGEDGKLQQVAAGKEVLLAAGAFESPAVLLRSGIGDEAQLDALAPQGVEKKLIRPGVGQSLSDRYEYGLSFRLKKPLDLAKSLSFKLDETDESFTEWKDDGKGPYSSNGAVVAFQAKSDPSMDDPDLYFFLVPGKFEGYHPGYSEEAVADPHMCSLVILHENKGDKKGAVKVDLDNPTGQPKINFQYHEEEGGPDDRTPLARGVQMGRKLMERFSDLIEEETAPGKDAQTLDEIKAVVGQGSWGHHANGTAKMGTADDPNAVVDSKFNVIGAKGLRVIDASTFPDNIGSFIVSAVMLQAEKAADVIDQDAQAAAAAKGVPVHTLRAQQK